MSLHSIELCKDWNDTSLYGLMIEWSRNGDSHVGQKHSREKAVFNFYFSLTINSDKYAVGPRLSSTN